MKPFLVLLALWHGANGIVMVLAGASWYRTVPGVADTGPFNPHFVQDIGLAFLAAAAALFAAGHDSRLRKGALLPAAVFLGGHAFLHLGDFIFGGGTISGVTRDIVTILIPGFAPALVLFLAAKRENPR